MLPQREAQHINAESAEESTRVCSGLQRSAGIERRLPPALESIKEGIRLAPETVTTRNRRVDSRIVVFRRAKLKAGPSSAGRFRVLLRVVTSHE